MPLKQCQHCGSVRHDDDPGGLCPGCLVKAGIEWGARIDPDAEPWPGPAILARGPVEPDQAAARPVDAEASLADRSFGDYEILALIARGGMGVVYKARQKSLDRIVALKMLLIGPHAPPESVRRFRAEAIATASLQHPHIVAIHDVGSWEGHHFLVMDLVEGRSLAQVISDLKFQISDVRRAAGWVKTVAEAVHYAHERGILHRDIKPSNVLIDAQGQPRVTDFGLAKRLPEESASSNPKSDVDLTLTGQVLGSPSYIPPEQASRRWGPLGRRSDVYALGAVLYHTLTGRPPFVGGGLAETLHQVLNVEPIAPRVLNPHVPADLETVCLQCLEKQPGKRYATAQKLADELGRFLEGQPVLARPVGRLAKAWRWCRRNPLPAAATTAALLCLLIGLTGVTWQWRRAETQRARAEAGEQSARLRGYVSDINLAQQALEANNFGRAVELLDRHRPAKETQSSKFKAQSQPDQRGWEWRYLWQECQSDSEAAISRLQGGIRDLAASSDGRFLAASSEFGEVRVWDLREGQTTDLASESGVQAFLAFSPDGHWLAFTDQTLDRPGMIGLWDTRTRRRADPIVDSHYVGILGFSPDGRELAFGVRMPGEEKHLLVWDFASRKQVRSVGSQTPIVDSLTGYAFVFVAGGQQIIAAENDGRLFRWDVRAGGDPEYFHGHQDGVTALAISPDGLILATGAGFSETGVKLWSMPSFRPLGQLTNHQGWISDLKFSPDGRTLASSSADQTIRLWDLVTMSEKRVLRGHRQEVRRLCFSADGRKLFSGDRGGTILRWPVEAPAAQPSLVVTPTTLSEVVLAPDLERFAGLLQGAVCLGARSSGRIAPPIMQLGTNISSLLFSRDGQHLFAGTREGAIHVWSLSREEIVQTLRGSGDPVRQLRQDESGRFLFALRRGDGELREGPCSFEIWNVATWQLRVTWTHPRLPFACALSPDGRHLATGHNPGVVLVWNLADGLRTNRLTFAGRISDLAFLPDGRWLAASTMEGSVKVWDIPTLREGTVIRAHSATVHALAFSPDSRRLATGSDGDEAVRIWDVATWQPLITLRRKGAEITGFAFAPQGDGIAVVDSREEREDIVLWKVPSLDQITQAEERRVGSE